MFDSIRWWFTEGAKYRRHIRRLDRLSMQENPASGGRGWVMRAYFNRAETLRMAMFHREPYDSAGGRDNLIDILLVVKRNDENYDIRNGLVLDAIVLARKVGYEAGFRIDPSEPDWPVAYIELPEGQVSWHLPAHPKEWDGHTTAEKYARIEKFSAVERSA
jgi:hypothetical protein